MYRLIYFVPIWLVFLLFRTALIILGLILIPLMAVFHKYTTIKEISIINFREIINWKYKLMYVFSNQEDGILAGDELKEYPNWIRIIYWSAIRNPANNLRFIKAFSLLIDPAKVKYLGSSFKTLSGIKLTAYPGTLNTLFDYDRDDVRFVTLTWQGIYANLRIQFKMFNKIWRFWIGWKIYPHDTFSIPEDDYRFYGAGFATQFKRIHPR